MDSVVTAQLLKYCFGWPFCAVGLKKAPVRQNCFFLWSFVIASFIYRNSFCSVGFTLWFLWIYCYIKPMNVQQFSHSLKTLTGRKQMTRGRNISLGVLMKSGVQSFQGMTCCHSQQCIPSASECEQASWCCATVWLQRETWLRGVSVRTC